MASRPGRELQTKLVTGAVTDSNLANALDISPETARSIIDAYFPNKVMGYNREDKNPLDKMLLQRTASVIGFYATYRMLDRDKLKI